MSLYILDHANAKFVSGLFWQVLSRPREAKAEAKELGESLQFDLLIIRSVGSVMQAGFCARSDGAEEGMTSIAALLSRAIEADDPPLNWVAAVALPSGEFAYAAVRDGAFLPDGDFAGSKDDVINKMTTDYALGDWDLVICPQDFAFPNSQEKSFEDFLVLDKKGRHKSISSTIIEPVKRTVPWKKLGIVAGVLAVAGAGAFAYQSYQERLEAERQAALLAEQQALMAADAEAKRNALPPYAAMAASLPMIKACEEEFFNLKLTPAGWEFEGGMCARDGSVKAGFKRGPTAGTIFDLKKEFEGKKIRVDWNGEVAIHDSVITLPKATKEVLLSAEEAVERMVGTAQQMDLKVAVRDAAGGAGQPQPAVAGQPGQPGQPGQAAAPAGPAGFAVLIFEARSNIQPSMYEKVFALPGVRPKSVKVTPSGEWTVEGEIYVEKK